MKHAAAANKWFKFYLYGCRKSMAALNIYKKTNAFTYILKSQPVTEYDTFSVLMRAAICTSVSYFIKLKLINK